MGQSEQTFLMGLTAFQIAQISLPILIAVMILIAAQLPQLSLANKANLATVLNAISERWSSIYPIYRSEKFQQFDPNEVVDTGQSFADFTGSPDWIEIREVLAFYEFIGSLVRSDVIEPHYVFSVVSVEEDVWQKFAPMIEYFRKEGGRPDLYIAWQHLVEKRREFPPGKEHLRQPIRYRLCFWIKRQMGSGASNRAEIPSLSEVGSPDGGQFCDIEALHKKPIPDLKELRKQKKGYRDYPLLPESKSETSLVSLTKAGLLGANHYATSRNPPYYEKISGSIDQLLARPAVLERLLLVEDRIRKAGLALWVFDAWRPVEIQREMYENWMPRYLAKQKPELSETEIARIVETYWAAPNLDEGSPAPHSTGAAVDLTLCWRNSGQFLWMGSIFDDVSEVSWPDHFENGQAQEIGNFSDAEARRNRRLLYWLMRDVGFSAHPNEWWHYSYGDQMWAKLEGAEAAIYSATKPKGFRNAP